MILSEVVNEIRVLRGNTKGVFVVFMFRVANVCESGMFCLIAGAPLRFVYKLVVQWVLGIDVPLGTKIGFAPRIYHGNGLVIHEATIIGDYVTLRHNTTIGNAHKDGGAPSIGNHVDIGANSVIIGEIQIGDRSIIAAGSVVIRNVPPDVVVAGNPARVVKVLGK